MTSNKSVDYCKRTISHMRDHKTCLPGRIFFMSSLLATALCFHSLTVTAKTPEETVDRLGKDLTPMGAIRAGSEDGLMPEWTGSVVGLPDGLEWDGPGTPYPDPWPDEKPLFEITAENLDEHRARLSPGQIAMFEAYPDTFRMPVFPGHREFAYYQNYYDKVLYNAIHGELTNDDEGIRGFVGGAAFPVPSTGAEAVAVQAGLNGRDECLYELCAFH